jgi:hypothetical protein
VLGSGGGGRYAKANEQSVTGTSTKGKRKLIQVPPIFLGYIVSLVHHIFIGEATSPMNICHIYLSVTWRH